MDVSKPKASSKVATRVMAPGSPHKGPPKFKQRSTRQFKSKPPKKGVIGYKYFLCFYFLFVFFLFGSFMDSHVVSVLILMLFLLDLVKKFLEWRDWELVCTIFCQNNIAQYHILLIIYINHLRLCVIIFFPLTDFNVICPWEAYSHLELHELAQYGII